MRPFSMPHEVEGLSRLGVWFIMTDVDMTCCITQGHPTVQYMDIQFQSLYDRI